MGGGPRTFPGGVTKWQWKRMLVKKRQDRMHYRLAREKAVYEMRRRAEVLATHPELLQPWEKLAVFPPPGISTGQHVATLVRRFYKQTQAEDLWTQRDGPQNGTNASSVDPESTNASPLSQQAQRSSSGLDADTSRVESFNVEAKRSPLRPLPFSARWLTMDTTSPKKKNREVSPIGKSMQDYLDAFDTDPLGVAAGINISGCKRDKDPSDLSVEKKETPKASPKKKRGKGGRKNMGR
ncbi:hypothetical protein L7F22_023074 [Adiantum nelumboides]|nr:hypothetical protein [Adiantum nelumboides]